MREERPSNLLPIAVVGTAIGVFGSIILASGGINPIEGLRVSDPRLTSARGFEEQYAMQKSAGATASDLCTRSKLVAEAYLQAEAKAKYEEWLDKSRTDCAISDLETAR